MSEIKSHKCPSCAGNLNINLDKQIYYCPFCGSTYDYEYFREEQMHKMCESYLIKGEFNAAIDGYRFLLQKDPHDFLALRGMMMASSHTKEIRDIIRKDDYRSFFYDEKMAASAIEDCSKEDKDYFEEFGRLYSEMKKLSALHKTKESLEKEQKNLRGRLSAEYSRRSECNVRDRGGNEHDPKFSFITMAVISGLLIAFLIGLIIMVFVSGSDAIGTTLLLGLLFGPVILLMCMITFKFLYPLYRSSRIIDQRIRQVLLDTAENSRQLTSIEQEVHTLSSEIRHDCLAFLKTDKSKIDSLS